MVPHPDLPRRLWRFALGACALAVAVLAFAPLAESPLTPSDKLNHVLAFAVLAWLAHGAYPQHRLAVARWGLLLGYGLSIELVQYFLPYREASWLDLAADAIGILCYGTLVLAVGKAGRRWPARTGMKRTEARQGRRAQ